MRKFLLLAAGLIVFCSSFSQVIPDTARAAAYTKMAIQAKTAKSFDSCAWYLLKAADYYGNADPAKSIESLFKAADIRILTEKYKPAKEICFRLLNLEKVYPSLIIPGSVEVKLGRINGQMGYYDSAFYYTSTADKRMPETPATIKSRASILMNLGNIYQHKGDIYKALDYNKRSLYLQQQFLNENDPGIGKILNNIGRCYMILDSAKLAMDYYTRAFNILSKAGDENSTAQIISNMKEVLWQMGKADSAMSLLKSYREKIISSYGKERSILASLDLKIGELYMSEKKFNEAPEYFLEALSIAEKIRSKKDELVMASKSFLAMDYAETGNYDQALSIIQETLGLICGQHLKDYYEMPDLQNADFTDVLVYLIRAKAICFRNIYLRDHNQKDMDVSVACLKQILDAGKKIPLSFSGPEIQIFMFGLIAKTYADCSEIAAAFYKETNDPRLAELLFEFSEADKAGNLTAAMQGSNALKFSSIPEEIISTEKEKEGRIAGIKQKISMAEVSQANDSILRILLDQKSSAEKDFDLFLEDIKTKYPSYASLKYNYHLVSPSEIRQILPESSAMINYYIADSSFFIFLLTKQDFKVFQYPFDSSFNKLVNDFRGGIKRLDNKQFLKSGFSLYRRLFPGKLPEGINKLFIVPSGSMAYIPFEALLTSLPKSEPSSDYLTIAPFLLKKYEFVYHFSSTLWFENMKNNHDKVNNVLAMAPSFEGEAAEGLRSQFGDLKNSSKEAEGIKKIFLANNKKAMILTGNQATKENFMKYAPGCDIIHLASHSFVNDRVPSLGGIAFSESKKDSVNDESGILYSGETYSMQLDAELIVLSSCESGIGKFYRGEGVMSLTRGFFYAGCRNVIYSLWKVYDNTTATLMTGFYENAVTGRSFSSSLRQAKLNMIKNKETALPKLWSGFLLLGE